MCGRTHDKRYDQESFTGDISFELVRKLDPFYRPSAFVITTGLGEPLLNPQMPPILKYLKARKATVSMTTNGTLLTEDLARDLVETQIDQIVLSIDSPVSTTFEQIRIGARLEDILHNVERLVRFRSQSPIRKPHLVPEFVAMAQNFYQLPALADLAHRLDFDEVIVQNLFKHFGPGYDAFYRKNKLSVLDPGETLEVWNEFLKKQENYSIRLYSPFRGAGIHQYLHEKKSRPARADRSSTHFMGFIDRPTALESVQEQLVVTGWATGKDGVASGEIHLESTNQNLRQPLRFTRPRPDVLSHLPEGFPQEVNCGFEERLDVSELEAGVYTVFLRLRDRSGTRLADLSRRKILIRSPEHFQMYCTQPWSTVYISWDGKVRTCCFNEYTLGDLHRESIEQIWNGANYQRFRQQVILGRVIPDCVDCLAGKSIPKYIRTLREWIWR